MNKLDPSDEELLSFLIGDCSIELEQQIKDELKVDPYLRKRFEILALLRGEIKNSPLSYKVTTRPKLNASLIFQRVAIVSFIFVIGLVTESNLKIISNEKSIEIDQSVSVSRPLSWDDSRLTSLM